MKRTVNQVFERRLRAAMRKIRAIIQGLIERPVPDYIVCPQESRIGDWILVRKRLSRDGLQENYGLTTFS
jgi:hypothetical protein